jgi:phage FluMu protein Com
MTSEMSEKSYQAVRCSHCSKLILLSTRLSNFFVAESNRPAELPCRSQAFSLRCQACSKESCYLKSEIEAFESGSPQTSDPNRGATIASALQRCHMAAH